MITEAYKYLITTELNEDFIYICNCIKTGSIKLQ